MIGMEEGTGGDGGGGDIKLTVAPGVDVGSRGAESHELSLGGHEQHRQETPSGEYEGPAVGQAR